MTCRLAKEQWRKSDVDSPQAFAAQLPVAGSQIVIRPYLNPDAANLPFGENAMAWTQFQCLLGVCCTAPVVLLPDSRA